MGAQGKDFRPTAIAACRSCGLPAKRLLPIFSLGDLHVSNFIRPEERSDRYPKMPLDLLLCPVAGGGCGLLQLKHTSSSEWMYQHYWYRSGTNASMRQALAEITDCAERLAKPSPGDLVLDIGCNDGTLLRSYKTDGLLRAGFEPASNLVPEASKQTDRILNAYFSAEEFSKAFPGRKAKVITSIAMFYDLEDPNRFTADIARCLDPEGLWVIQMSYLPRMLEQNAFDNVCHEHLEYYSLYSLSRLLERHSLSAADVELNDVNGGSFRVYVCRPGSALFRSIENRDRIEGALKQESSLGLDGPAPYRAFAQRVERIKGRLVRFIEQEHGRGKKIYVYGASTKGNTLLQFFGLDSRLIRAAAERSPDKWGKVTIGTGIPILSEEQARREKPDFFLILPWHFLEEFIRREEEYLKAGGRFLVPLPEPREITWNQSRPL